MSARRYVVCELIRDGVLFARWTSRVPGVTGPRTLEKDAERLASGEWHVFWVQP